MGLTPEQVDLRRSGIAASEVAAIVGCHPYRSAIDVWLEKTGQAAPFDGNRRTVWGEILEPAIRADYERLHDVSVEVHGTLVHPERDWWFYTPDGLVYPRGQRSPERGLEIKVHGESAIRYGGLEYGPPGTDEVPVHEMIQCQWGIGGSHLERWDLIVFMDGAPLEYTIDRDDELIGMLEGEAERFLVDHVRTGVAPPADGSEGWDRWLDRKYRASSDVLRRVDADPAAMAEIRALRAARQDMADAGRRCAAVEQTLKDRIGADGGLTWREPGRLKRDAVRWKHNRDGVRDDWRTTAQDIRLAAGLVAEAKRLAIESAAAELSMRPEHRWLAEAVEAVMGALRSAATAPTATVTVPGARPFTVPRHWSRSRDAGDDTDDKPQE